MAQDDVKSRIDKLTGKAKSIASDAKAANELLEAAVRKAESGKSPLKGIWGDFQSLVRMLRAWVAGKYRGVSIGSVLAAIAGLLYLVNPLDIVSDFIPGAGLLDDATVLAFVIARIRSDLKKFLTWESSQPSEDKSQSE
jgi:uncharacterized membrane protein YkvA (DUF1232 family)